LNSLEDGYSFYNVNESVFFSKCWVGLGGSIGFPSTSNLT
jgi:hypothetical protein